MYQALQVFTNDFVTFDVEVSVLVYGMTKLYGVKDPVTEYIENYLRANDFETVNDYDFLKHYDKLTASRDYRTIISNLDLCVNHNLTDAYNELWETVKPKIHIDYHRKAEDELLKRILFDRFNITDEETKFATHMFNIIMEKNKRDVTSVADDFLIFVPLVDYADCLH